MNEIKSQKYSKACDRELLNWFLNLFVDKHNEGCRVTVLTGENEGN